MRESNNEKLHRVLDLVAPSLVEAAPQWAKATTAYHVKGLYSMIAQEPVMALTLICSDIEERGCSVSQEAYELLQEVGEDFYANAFIRSTGLKREVWENLRSRVF